MSHRTIFAVIVLLMVLCAVACSASELRFCLRSEPKTFNPLMVDDESSETIRYLTGGVLVRVNRHTQQLEPELATSWKVTGGRSISFKLRSGIYFSDGTPFSAEDVAFTIQQMMDPNLHTPTGDSFRSGNGNVQVKVLGKAQVVVTFPVPVAGLDALFDQVAIMSARSPRKEMAVLGAFYVADHKPGAFVLLNRNPNYWKRDVSGRQLPYLDSIRLDIQQNREIELMRFKRGEIHLINSIDAELFERLSAESAKSVYDSGASMDTEQMWFNQVASAPIAAYKKAWFTSHNFRRALSQAINRTDLCRVIYANHARPAIGPVSPANQFWFNRSLQPIAHNPKAAIRLLEQDGFRLQDKVLHDRDGHAVEFSIITNSGNKARERMAAMIQQDLAQIGIKVNVVTLDFPSLIERITRTFNYEASLLGFVNGDLDPSSQMNVWLSSAANHAWNPLQKTPATEWEAKVDKLMQVQASSQTPKVRKAAWDEVQAIALDEQPFIYLVNKNSLSAVSPQVRGASPVVLRPQTYWNAERLSLATSAGGSR